MKESVLHFANIKGHTDVTLKKNITLFHIFIVYLIFTKYFFLNKVFEYAKKT